MRYTFCFFFFFNDTATTEIYTLSLHDALPISLRNDGPELLDHHRQHRRRYRSPRPEHFARPRHRHLHAWGNCGRSEEHTSELQSQSNLVCRLLLEKKKTEIYTQRTALSIASAI